MKITAIQRLIFVALSVRSPMTLGQLVTYTGSTPFSLRQILSRMVAAGYLTHIRNDNVYLYSLNLRTISPDSEVPIPIELRNNEPPI
jgi:DNA-binding IclR family transcriptional regulator